VTTLPTRRRSRLQGATRALALVAAPLVLAASRAAFAGGSQAAPASDAPSAEITNGLVTARFYLPDAERGHYRGTRFDRSGDTFSLRFAGHEFTGPWFEHYDPLGHDSLMGPVEEFLTGDSSPGYPEAKVGEGFVRIGVGVVRKAEDKPYERFRTYEVVDPGKWTITTERDRIVFEHALTGPTGYAYVYRKTIALLAGQPVMTIAHALRNVGTRRIETEQYNHNFFVLDQAPTGPDTSVRFAFDPRGTTDRGLGQLALLRGRELVFPDELPPKQSVFTELTGFGSTPEHYDIRVENRKAGTGVRIQGDRPLEKLVFWSIRTTACPEPYVKLRVEPGREEAWTLRYELYELEKPRAAPGATR
jgi:hypothetical protein